MAEASVDRLIAVDSRLTRSFVAAAVFWLAGIVWALFMGGRISSGDLGPAVIALVILLLQVVSYVWYALAAGAAAKALGGSGWRYVVWILAAPVLALVPIPIVSVIINASPLSIKFLLGGQLQTAIREASFADLHQVG
jgi:hypothetical protein